MAIDYTHTGKIPKDSSYFLPTDLTKPQPIDTTNSPLTAISNSPLNWENVIGNKTINDGGMLGDILTIVRVHLQDAKDKQELTESISGEVYSSMFAEALTQAINFESQSKAMTLKNTESYYARKKDIASLEESNMSLILKKEEFSKLLPRQIRKIEEEIYGLHAKHKENEADFLIKKFIHERLQPIEESNNSNKSDGEKAKTDSTRKDIEVKSKDIEVKSKDIEVKSQDVAIKTQDAAIKKYYSSNMQSLEKDALAKDVCIKTQECAIKTFYKDSMQPIELTTLKSKAESEHIKAGRNSAGVYESDKSLTFAQISASNANKNMLDRQTEAFNDRKFHELLKLKLHYRTIIYADNPEPIIPDMVKDANLNITYKHLTGEEVVIVPVPPVV